MDENRPSPPRPLVRIIGRIVDDGVVELKTPWPDRRPAIAAATPALERKPRED